MDINNKDNKNIILTQRGNEDLGVDLLNKSTPKSHEKEQKPSVSILLTYENNYENLNNCIFKIKENTENVKYEIILIDDSLKNETINLPGEIQKLKTIKNKKKLGFVKSINLAAKEAKGEFLCIMKNNPTPCKKWMDFLLQPMQEEKIAIVSAKIINKERFILHAGGTINKRGFIAIQGLLKPSELLKFNIEKKIESASSHCMLIKKNAWDKIGGFDEQFYPSNYEDADLCLSLQHKLGLETCYQPNAEVILEPENKFYKENLIFRNHTNFFTKWKKQIQEKFKDETKKAITINICFGLIDKLCQHAGATMASILVNSNLDDKYHFYIISDYISDKNKKYFEQLKSIRNFEITYLNIDEKDFSELLSNEYGVVPYYRFRIFDLVKEDKILYLDSDIIVRQDLRELYETDISDYLCAAVEDPGHIGFSKRLNLKPEATYINSGVMLINIDKCRKENVLEKLYSVAKNPPAEIIHLDQDFLNYVMQGCIKILDMKWNCMFPYFLDLLEKQDFYVNQSQDPAIMHYITKEKPWFKNSKAHKKTDYYRYLSLTPWFNDFKQTYIE